MTTKKKPKTGPAPERVKLSGDWQEAVAKALTRPTPAEGWSKPVKKKREKKP